MSTDTILEGLNPEQVEAVTHGSGPLLIIAGAGTGKTKVIAHRIASLITSKRAKPEQILAVTFTEKAAAEMEERVDIMLPYGFANVWISTFHAFGERVLREHALKLGLIPDFQIVTEPEQVIFLREHLFEFPLHYYRPLGNPTKHLSALTKVISRAKDEDVTPDEYLKFARKLEDEAKAKRDDPELQEEAFQQKEIASLYYMYQELLAKEGKVDFGDLVILPLKLFREHPLILKEYRERFEYVLVDEFQDTNHAQFQLLQLLTGDQENITVVGDDDQSIYKFRGAAISNILTFKEVYPKAKQIILTKNYRSSQAILDTAYRVITNNNPERLEVRNNIDKRLSAYDPEGQPVRHLHYDTLASESDAVATMIDEKVASEQYTYKDFSVLVRTNNGADPFLRALNMRSIPYTFSGSRGLYSREEVRLLVSFLRVISNLSDSISLYHLAASEIYQMEMTDLTRCMNVANRQNRTLRYVFEHMVEFSDLNELSSESKATIGKLLSDIQEYIDRSKDNQVGVIVYQFLTESGYLKRLTHAGTVVAEQKIRNIAKFFDVVSNFSNLTVEDRVLQFVSHLDLLIEAGDDPATADTEPEANAVHVLTVHKAKGLEFPVVFVVSLVDGQFPVRRRSDPIELPDSLIKEVLPKGDMHLQEERRLFYVSMTRAQKELYLTSARDYGGVRQRKVSQFVLEAMDKPRADEEYVRASALEAIHRYAPPPETTEKTVDTIPDDQILYLSHYQIDDYRTCPLKYKYIHILRVPILPHHSVVYGRAIHEAVKEYHQRKMNGQKISEEELVEVFERSWMSEGFLTREHEERRLETGRRALHNFFEDQEQSGLTPTYVEEEFNFFLGKNKVVGRWDRVDVRGSEVIIIDFKSSDVRKQKDADRRVKESLQLNIYALAYQESYDKIPDAVELHFLDSGLVGRARPTEKKMEQTIEKINRAASGIRARDYTAKPDYMACTYCAYSNVCPATVSGS